MAGFASYDQIINAITANAKGERVVFEKASITTVAAGKYSLSYAGGFPPALTFGTALTATAVTQATSGAIVPFTNATAPATKHLITAGVSSTVAAGVYMIYDLLARYPLNGTVTSGSFTTVALPARDNNGATAGAGVKAMVINANATATTAVNLTLNYTNSAGTGSRSTGAQAIIAAAQHRVVHDTQGLFMPMAAGDVGIRQVDSYTLSATATSTQLEIQLIRPLCFIPVNVAAGYTERSLVTDMPALPRLFDGTALNVALIAGTTSSGVTTGLLQYAEN